MTFDPSKPVQTKDGRPARIIARDLKLAEGGTMIALVQSKYDSGCEFPIEVFPDGHSINSYGGENLINIDDFAKPDRDIVLTRDGQRVWILTREAPGERPIVGIREGNSGPNHWMPRGEFVWATQSHLDLML